MNYVKCEFLSNSQIFHVCIYIMCIILSVCMYCIHTLYCVYVCTMYCINTYLHACTQLHIQIKYTHYTFYLIMIIIYIHTYIQATSSRRIRFSSTSVFDLGLSPLSKMVNCVPSMLDLLTTTYKKL